MSPTIYQYMESVHAQVQAADPPGEGWGNAAVSANQADNGGARTAAKTRQHTAFHGSPHEIEGGFDTEKVGSGEGFQAYGWGLYFSSQRAVAQWYKNILAGTPHIELDSTSDYPGHQPGKRVKLDSFSAGVALCRAESGRG